jgi:hypothetical protein
MLGLFSVFFSGSSLSCFKNFLAASAASGSGWVHDTEHDLRQETLICESKHHGGGEL